MDNCEHDYKYLGMRWRYGRQIPGSGAHEVEYFEAFYCSKCVDFMYKPIGSLGNSYEKRIEGSLPMEKV